MSEKGSVILVVDDERDHADGIIEAHNGTISVDSELGKGTSFTIKV
ncbi:MAG: cell wall metabolism sensor histidine kinase WalK, partial [Planctomycetes bacterium]|nr:cell wall metabolism sensor histidine kinase WalK [Planctomycetota bacterium]